MTGHYEPDHSETAAERAEREHDARLEREDRAREKGPAFEVVSTQYVGMGPSDTGDAHVEGGLTVSGTGHLVVTDIKPGREVLPRDLDDYPEARAKVERMAEDYASVEVDRLPPMGALHWLVRGHRADGSVDVFRVGAHGSLMPWTELGS